MLSIYYSFLFIYLLTQIFSQLHSFFISQSTVAKLKHLSTIPFLFLSQLWIHYKFHFYSENISVVVVIGFTKQFIMPMYLQKKRGECAYLPGIDGSWPCMCNLGHTRKKESVISKRKRRKVTSSRIGWAGSGSMFGPRQQHPKSHLKGSQRDTRSSINRETEFDGCFGVCL
jgi:hypothetical protein